MTGIDTSSDANARWSVALVVLAVSMIIFVLLYWQTLASMVAIWRTSDTFAHGFLVFPASAWLAWRLRGLLTDAAVRPSTLGLIALLGALLLWLVARLGSVQVAEQFAFVFALIALVWTVLGTDVLRRFAFPLGFLLFAVPFGEVAIPQLMQFTAWFTVAAINLVGIPVYQDGFLLSIPSGDFEVAKACSGIRYVIASFSLGTLYAYLTYTSPAKRALFMLFALLLPIVANGLRAFGIVMLAHASGMKLAVGLDHLIYGWLFFGVVMFLAFWIGGRYSDDTESLLARDFKSPVVAASRGRVLAAGVISLLLSASLPWFLDRADARVAASEIAPPALPLAASSWRGPDPAPDAFVPAYLNYDALLRGRYSQGAAKVDLVVHGYLSSQAEMINAMNVIANDERFMILDNEPVTVHGGDGRLWSVSRAVVRGGGGRRIVYYWFQVGERQATGIVAAKIAETLARVRGHAVPRALVSVSQYVDDDARLASVAEAFIAAHGEQIVRCINAVDVRGCSAPPL